MKFELDKKTLMKFTYSKILDITKDYVKRLIDNEEIDIKDEPLTTLWTAVSIVVEHLYSKEREFTDEKKMSIMQKMVNDFGKINFDENENDDKKGTNPE